MGFDNLQTFDKWKNFEQILEDYELYIYPRHKYEGMKFIDHSKVKITDAPVMELSSSFIRKAIKEKMDVRYMMPEAVNKYIDEMNFYKK